MARITCPECELASINGVICHEHGCRNSGARYDRDSGEWIKQRKCWECGCTVDRDDPCCSDELEGDELEGDELEGDELEGDSAPRAPKTTTAVYLQRGRVYQRHMRLATRRARALCPASGGNECLCRNWSDFDAGAALAAASWSRENERWRHIAEGFDRAYRLALHREHAGQFKPLWCPHCADQHAGHDAVS